MASFPCRFSFAYSFLNSSVKGCTLPEENDIKLFCTEKLTLLFLALNLFYYTRFGMLHQANNSNQNEKTIKTTQCH